MVCGPLLSNGRQRVGALLKRACRENAFKHSYTVECGNRLRVGVPGAFNCQGFGGVSKNIGKQKSRIPKRAFLCEILAEYFVKIVLPFVLECLADFPRRACWHFQASPLTTPPESPLLNPSRTSAAKATRKSTEFRPPT